MTPTFLNEVLNIPQHFVVFIVSINFVIIEIKTKVNLKLTSVQLYIILHRLKSSYDDT